MPAAVPARVELSGPNGGPVPVADLSDEERRARFVALSRELTARLEDSSRTRPRLTCRLRP